MENKKFTLKKYDSIDEIILACWQNEDNSITIEDLKESPVGGLDCNENEHEFSYDDQKEGIEQQGIWGWIDDDKVIHYWIGKELSTEELIHFFAHEIGHQTGKQDDDGFQEEMRAEGYGHTATIAYEFAKLVKKENKMENKYSIQDFLNLIEEFKQKELPNRNIPYHYEAEIESGLKHFEIFIKGKIKNNGNKNR